MYRSSILPIAGLLVLGMGSASHAAVDRTTFQMPCSQVLRMSVDNFVKLFMRRAHDGSEAGQDAAYGYYYDCELKRDQRRERRLGAAGRRLVERVRKAMDDYETDYIYLKNAGAGGGTMYTHTASRVPAYREEEIARIMTLVRNPGRNSTSRLQTSWELVRIQTQIAKLQKMPDPELLKDNPIAKGYPASYRDLQKSSLRLFAVIQALPDGAAWRAAKYAGKVLKEFD